MEKLIEHSLEREDDIEMMCWYMAWGWAILMALFIPLGLLIYFFQPFFNLLQ